MGAVPKVHIMMLLNSEGLGVAGSGSGARFGRIVV